MKKVALVTGGTRGIGFDIAMKLSGNGYDLAVNGVREPAKVKDILSELESTGARVIYCQGDVGSSADRQRVVHEVKSEYGRLNVLVNNAGVAPLERMDPLFATEESFERLIRINLQGPYFLTQLVSRWMIEQKQADHDFEGCIVNIGSISASVVSYMRGDYCISKAGFSMHSKIWAVRMAEYGIPVYEVQPGVIKTDMTAAVNEKYDKLIDEGLNLQPRWGTPDDVGRAVIALVMGYFPFSAGEVFMVDGGLGLRRL